MKQMLVVFEINGERRGYKGNRWAVERFFKALCSSGVKVQIVTAYKLV